MENILNPRFIKSNLHVKQYFAAFQSTIKHLKIVLSINLIFIF